MTFDWYFTAYHWLYANGLWRDMLATGIGLSAARAIAARPINKVKASQARQEDLLDTNTPGGLAEVQAELQKLRKMLGDIPEDEPEDETPDTDDHDGTEEPEHKEEPKWLKTWRKARKGHGASMPEKEPQSVTERPHTGWAPPPGGHR